MRFNIYLSVPKLRDRRGQPVAFPERRLIRQSPEDRVIAVVDAPRGSWIRRRRDQHGFESLVIPLEGGLWGRHFGLKAEVPVKYLINSARRHSHGLVLLEYEPSEVES